MLTLIRSINLPDRPFYTSVSADGRRFAASSGSTTGPLRLFDEEMRPLDEFVPGAGVRWIQLDGTGARLFVGFSGHVECYSTEGGLALSSRISIGGTSGGCCVVPADENVLCVASWDRRPLITAVDLATGARIAEAPLPDRGGEGFTLVAHPEGEAMAATSFSGDGWGWTSWTHYAQGRFRVFERPELDGVIYPIFHPTGRELVSRHGRLGLGRLRFPSGELIASVQEEEAFPDDPEDQFSYPIHFFRDDRFLAWQADLALHEFDLETLERRRAVLTGVDGRIFGQDSFFSQESWSLAGGRLLTGDVDIGRGFQVRADTLRLWDASGLMGPISTPDPARRYTRELLADG